jgi:hypothetical protein
MLVFMFLNTKIVMPFTFLSLMACRRYCIAASGLRERQPAPAGSAITKKGRPGTGPGLPFADAGRQKPLTFSRPSLTTLPLHDAVGTAEPRIPALTSAAVAPERVDLYSAAPPATCGVAIEVPL